MNDTKEEKQDKNIEQQSEEAAAGQPAEEASPQNDALKEFEEALAAKDAEARENWDKFVRERADLENYRKRVQREKEEILKYGNEGLIIEILPVLDSMDRALSHANEEAQGAVIEGVKLTHGMLLSALKKYGVEPVDATKGTPFDPSFHHAMAQVENAELAPNSVVEEFQKGYILQGRLLRAAMVSVAIAPKGTQE